MQVGISMKKQAFAVTLTAATPTAARRYAEWDLCVQQ